MTVRTTLATATLLVLTSTAGRLGAQEPGAVYWAYVANESSDLVSLIRFDGQDIVEEKAIEVGFHPADIEGAHGIAVSPSGEHWYVSIAHGQPYGQVWKMETGTDVFVDSALVGLFPATMALTPDGSGLFVVNFNLHGDPVPSTVSALFTPWMQETRQIETCVMPHGSRVSRDGSRHYSTCMMSDQLVEIAIGKRRVSRRMLLTAGHEHVLTDSADGAGGMDMGGAGICKPTWVVVAPDDSRLYVPCNGRGEVLEIDAASLEVRRRFPTGRGPYNADVTPDGTKLVVTLKGDRALTIFDLATGVEKRVPTSRPVTHGVVVTPDGRYALVTNEAVGATRGTVDAVDLGAARVVASAPLHYQPGGIGFWKMERR